MLKSLLAAAFLFTTFTSAYAEDAKMVRTLSLSGHGEVRAVPDLAVVNMGVLTSSETADAALDANNNAMTNLMAVLQAAKIEPKDISTSNFSVNPRYDYGQNNGQPPKVTGYDVSNTVTVLVHELTMIGELLDKSVASGSNQINGISFSLANPEAAMDAARKVAVNDAKRKADLYAMAAAVTLGNVISVSEGALYQPPQPMMMQAKMSASDGAAVPISQGEHVIAIDVNMVWEIK